MADLRTFAISSGRTGTVFLTERLPALYPQLHAVHEPPGSRSTLVAGNLRNLVGRGSRLLRAKWRLELERRLAEVPSGAHYLEVNPMLVPVTDLLAEVEPLRLVHLTRHPRSWTQSIRTFKASSRFRPVIDFLPLANPYPTPRPEGWLGTDQVHKALWRWRYGNEQILALAPNAERYLHLRYEDLFAEDVGQRDATLAKLLDFLELPPCDDPAPLYASGRANPAPPGARVEVPEESIAAICGSLMAQLGYSPVPDPAPSAASVRGTAEEAS
ncbi:MAG: hypothetical protein EP330_10585 [Deltaproteobacteria bacterium]|nr:MAG: hypothetical protein EP330_10585 [Deltaproteobacteria bacterium]